MRHIVIIAVAALGACSEPASEWKVQSDTGTADAALSELAGIDTMNRTKELLTVAPNVDRLTIRYFGPVQDRLGNDVKELFYSAHFDGKEIASANFDNLDLYEAAALAKSVTRGSKAGNQILFHACPFADEVCADALKLRERP